MKKLLALLLALLMIAGTLTLAACGDEKESEKEDAGQEETKDDEGKTDGSSTDEGKTDTGDSSDGGETEPTDGDKTDDDSPYLDHLGTYDFGGDVVMLMINGTDAYVIEDPDDYNDGDVVEAAVYTRQSEIEERFNVVFEATEDKNSGEIASNLNVDVSSGSGDYDIVQGHMKFDASAALAGCCLNLQKLTNIDFSQDYWNDAYTNAWTYKTLTYWTTGDITYKYIKEMVGIFVNADYFTEYFPEEDLFTLVFDGKWTLEKMYEFVSNFAIDNDGDGMMSAFDSSGEPGDTFGFVFENMWTMSSVCYGAGINLTEKSGSKYVLNLQTAENETIYSEVVKFLTDNHTVRVTYTDPMSNETCLFTTETIDRMEGWRELEFEYYTLPMPKYSEEQSYRTPHYDGVPIVGVDAVLESDRYEEIGVVMEALAAAGKKYLTPAYFETALQAKFARNEGTMKCLSIIRENAWCDFGFAWCQPLAELDTRVGDAAFTGISSLASLYAQYGTSYEKKINDLYATLSKLEKADKSK